MIKPEKPANEMARMAELERYEILDTAPERSYDDLLAIAAAICNTPMGSVTLVAGDRQWFKSRLGLAAEETARDVAFCGHAILNPEDMLIVPDTLLDERFHDNPFVTGDPKIRFYAGAPLVMNGQATGTFCVMDSKPRELTPFQKQAMISLSRQAAALLELRAALRDLRHHISERTWYEQKLEAYQELLEEQNAELTELSKTDALTGLPNRRAFRVALAAAISDSSSQGRPFCVALLDVDHFKLVNDLHGHPAGDRVLASIARALEAQRGNRGFVARSGGEEFVVLLPDTAIHAAELQCEFMRQAVQDMGHGLPVTISIGVTQYRPGDDGAAIYARVDEALYEAKRNGRNRVETK
jgi:diguanylate cyclase (GGDEF)-like protein